MNPCDQTPQDVTDPLAFKLIQVSHITHAAFGEEIAVLVQNNAVLVCGLSQHIKKLATI